jgi:hypothetical protein
MNAKEVRTIATGFESSIIRSWSGWDGDLDMMQFYDPVLAVDVFEVGKAGDLLEGWCVFFTLESSTLTFYNDKNEEVKAVQFSLEIKDASY